MPGRTGGKLLREATEKAFLFERSATLLYVCVDGLRQRKMRKQRDNVGEGLMKRQTVDARGFCVAAMQAIEHCVRRFMCDDVMRQRSEYPVGPGRSVGAAEISEQ